LSMLTIDYVSTQMAVRSGIKLEIYKNWNFGMRSERVGRSACLACSGRGMGQGPFGWHVTELLKKRKGTVPARTL
jgi:hypothetical protein